MRKSVSDTSILPSPRVSQASVKKPRFAESESRIKVVVRKRPLSQKELKEADRGILEVVPTPPGAPGTQRCAQSPIILLTASPSPVWLTRCLLLPFPSSLALSPRSVHGGARA